jgi:hypothetical protein
MVRRDLTEAQLGFIGRLGLGSGRLGDLDV